MRLGFNGANLDEIANEAKAVALLCTKGHPNIVEVLAHGRLSIVNYYIDMELCDLSLAELLKRKAKGEGLEDWYLHLPRRENVDDRIFFTIALMQELANGLYFIHKHDKVHRDIKPENGTTFSIHFLTVFASSLFGTHRLVETRRLRSCHSRHNNGVTWYGTLTRDGVLCRSGTFIGGEIQ
jgi:hypothetical protein